MTDEPIDPPAGPLAREALALAAFDHVVSRLDGFRPRAGQREMAAHIAETLSGVDWPARPEKGEDTPPPGPRAIAVVQAGTGVGKSAAYAATVIPLALAQGKRVMISTATVALQEQLIAKDLPALAAVLPQPFAFTLAKGRGRYVCRLKLDQMAGGDVATSDLFGDEADDKPAGDALERVWAERGRIYERWGQMLDGGDWDGDRDRLAEPPEGDVWTPVAAERKSVTWKLKRGVTWHDGQPFTADDCVFTWEYARDPATAAITTASTRTSSSPRSIRTPSRSPIRRPRRSGPRPSWPPKAGDPQARVRALHRRQVRARRRPT